jgi:hypothetical protein
MRFVPQTIIPFITCNSESWINELRCVSVLFVNLGLKLENHTSEASEQVTCPPRGFRARTVILKTFIGSEGALCGANSHP